MPMAMRLVLGAMAHERDGAGTRQRLQQPQREFLAVVPDCAVARIDAAAFQKLLLVATRELAPAHALPEDIAQQGLARPEIGHPDIVAVRRQAAATQPGRKNSQAVV